MSDVLAEEFEVLESIYPNELTKLSDNEIEIVVEPDEKVSGEQDLTLSLKVKYPESYPDVVPDLLLDVLDGSLDDPELERLMDSLNAVGRENLGIAMTFTLVSHIREELVDILRARADHRQRQESEKERLAIEAEELRTRGTPVTQASFLAWKTNFDKEMEAKRISMQESHLRGLPPRERDEIRKVGSRLSGRQLFERDRDLATSDSTLVEEGTVSIDVSQYDRSENSVDVLEEETVLHFSDSD